MKINGKNNPEERKMASNKTFNQRPTASSIVPSKPKSVTLYTNLYKLKLGSELSVY